MKRSDGYSARRQIRIASRASTSLILLWATIPAGSQGTTKDPPIGTVHAEVIRVSDRGDDIETEDVSVRLDVRASNQALVIPYCGGSDPDNSVPCIVQFQKRLGTKWVYAKPVFPVDMGVEEEDKWKAFELAPGQHASFYFYFSRRFFGIQDGQALRVRIGVWNSSNAWNGGVPDHILWSTIFYSPSKSK
jgi:hypothetical protein